MTKELRKNICLPLDSGTALGLLKFTWGICRPLSKGQNREASSGAGEELSWKVITSTGILQILKSYNSKPNLRGYARRAASVILVDAFCRLQGVGQLTLMSLPLGVRASRHGWSSLRPDKKQPLKLCTLKLLSTSDHRPSFQKSLRTLKLGLAGRSSAAVVPLKIRREESRRIRC